MLFLGIESSCDETGVALVQTQATGAPRLLSHALFSQIDMHQAYGGVVPEVASRQHILSIEQVIRDATDLTASVAPWLQADHEGLTGKVLKWPERAEIDTPVQEQLIVELYSK